MKLNLCHRPAMVLGLAAILAQAAPATAGLTGAWSQEGGRDEGVYGRDVHTAGDVNGDGYDDIIIASPGVGSATGEVTVHYGSATGIVSPAAWTMTGITTHYGSHVSTAGDIDGDGFDDVLIGTGSYNNGHQGEGQVQLFLGGAAGLAAAPVWSFESNNLLAGLGPVAYAGDVNDDGLADFLMGAPAYNSGNGRVWLYFGHASGTPTFGWSATSGLGERLGTDVATAGDVNGDGRCDIILGTYFSERVLVGISDPVTTINLTVINSPSVVAAARFGFSVGTMGDVTGDGYADIAVGAPRDSSGQWEEGKVYLYRGHAGGISTTPLWQYQSNVRDAELGSDLSTAGDINGDGYADAIFGAKKYTNGQNFEGAAYAFYGYSGGLRSTPFWFAEGEASPGLFGGSLSCAGDVNGDGYSDIIVGASAFEENVEFDEGKVAVWHGGPDMPSYQTYLTEANQEEAQYGAAVCLGDFDGDGFSEHVVGAALFDLGDVDQGQVWVYPGGPGSPSTSPTAILTFQPRSDHFGAAVDNAHDVTGDGYDELIVGAPMSFDGAAAQTGAAHVYRGGPGGLNNSALWTIWGPHEFSSFGHSVSWAGDVNADGLADVIVGAPHFDNGQIDEGAAYVYLGTSAGISTAPAWSWEGGVEGALFGWDVANVGDVDGDGYGDVIVGAPGHPEDAGSGRAYVFFGDANGISAAAPWIATTSEFDELGYSVAGCDANGDGFSDVVVGAPGFGGPTAPDFGQVLVYLSDGAGLSSAPSMQETGPHAGARLGSAVAAADFDQDGSDELVAGSPFATNGSAEEGQVRVYEAASGTVLWTAEGNSPLAWLGTSVASRGDVNGDGFPDVITGAPGFESPLVEEGRAFVWIGNAGEAQNLSPGLRRRAHQALFDNSRPVGLLGENDDAASIRLESDGRSPMGRDIVRLEVEVKPYGTPFDGTGLLMTPFTDTAAPASNGSNVNLHVIVVGIASDTRYHWRARHVSRHPYASSPWFSPSGNAWEEVDFRRLGFSTSVAEIAGSVTGTFALSRRPSPFAESTTIEFELPRAAHVELAVYDIAGRRVAVVLSGPQAAGWHSVRWNGTDGEGRRVGSGVYFAVIESEERREARRLVITR